MRNLKIFLTYMFDECFESTKISTYSDLSSVIKIDTVLPTETDDCSAKFYTGLKTYVLLFDFCNASTVSFMSGYVTKKTKQPSSVVKSN